MGWRERVGNEIENDDPQSRRRRARGEGGGAQTGVSSWKHKSQSVIKLEKKEILDLAEGGIWSLPRTPIYEETIELKTRRGQNR